MRPPLFGVSIVAVALLIIMGCLVQAIREALATEVSVEIGKPISLLSNQALGPVLHSLIQMSVPRTGLAKLSQQTPLLHPHPPPHPLLLPFTQTHTVTISASFATVLPSVSSLPSFCIYGVLLLQFASSPLQRTKLVFGAIWNTYKGVSCCTKVVLPDVE